MTGARNMAIKAYKAKITDTSDGERQKMTNSADKNLWIPASAGMTRLVGGHSH